MPAEFFADAVVIFTMPCGRISEAANSTQAETTLELTPVEQQEGGIHVARREPQPSVVIRHDLLPIDLLRLADALLGADQIVIAADNQIEQRLETREQHG